MTTPTIGWLDCSAGVAGDMLLGALADLGALDGLDAALAAIPVMGLRVGVTEVRRGGLRALAAGVSSEETDPPERSLADLLALLEATPVPAPVRRRAAAVFRRLARAEAAAHGVDVAAVQFHEVGGADSYADVVGACFGLHRLRLERLVTSPISLGGGSATTRHGRIPVPGPAVLALLAESSLVGRGGPAEVELATPTGVALLAEWADGTGPMPPMRVAGTGIGAGSRDLPDAANVTRLVIGSEPATATPERDVAEWVEIAANVDDLDPRLWPGVLEALLAAGAADAWLTPITMKKGRPAHTVHALAAAEHSDVVGRAIFTATSTIGLRRHGVTKLALPREVGEVVVAGHRIRVKLSMLDGRVVTATPEWADVAAAAAAAGVPARRLLAMAAAEASRLLGSSPTAATGN